MALLIRFRLAAVLALVASALSPRLAARPQETLEADVKAAFLYNFTKFVDWPPSALPPDGFHICAVGDAKVAEVLGHLVHGESAAGRPLVLLQPQTAADAERCQILYIGGADRDVRLRLLAAVREAPVLTAGDSPRFTEEGGTIGFVLEQNRVRFDVSLAAAERVGLRISSKLLRVARRVDGAR